MKRAYYSNTFDQFKDDNPNHILGILAREHSFALDDLQKNSWVYEINHLKEQLRPFQNGHIFIEFSIPRMGKRADIILILHGIIFILEYKVGAEEYSKHSMEQVLDYAVDLKNFHEGSHALPIVPILVATQAGSCENVFEKFPDEVFKPLKANRSNLEKLLQDAIQQIRSNLINPEEWANSPYKPTPTIIEAAQALYQNHSVTEISRSDAGAFNLSRTAEAILQIVSESEKRKQKSICLITGVPGAGKTLAGLNIANQYLHFGEDEHAVFLSGNGPLVQVLQEALARNEILDNNGNRTRKKTALTKAKAFIQNIHHFRDDALERIDAPLEKVVIFDEAQRAWDKAQTKKFMATKKGKPDFAMSEPEFLIQVMDRHSSWAVIICLIGGGQEINTGEAGLLEWFSALRNHFNHWKVYASDRLTDVEYLRGEKLASITDGLSFTSLSELHLSTSIRSFRSEKVSEFVKHLLDNDSKKAINLISTIRNTYPIVLTRNLSSAKLWLRSHARGSERYGILASSGAYRLKPFGINVHSEIDVVNWFLNGKEDIRSSFFLEDPATEFDIQGLELDWTCVAWDADLRHDGTQWTYKTFKGTKWQNLNDPTRILYLVNAYRVLLTRARQGMVIFIPNGEIEDHTRQSSYYDKTYEFLINIGIPELHE